MQASKDVALQNLRSFEKEQVDFIITLCASCASHLRHNYPVLFKNSELDQSVQDISSKVIDISSFIHDHLNIEESTFSTNSATPLRVTYHSPCHLCRGLGVHDAPKSLMQDVGLHYIKAEEEETCCGFGGTYSTKFPELSEQILANKLTDIEQTGAELLLTDCPVCIMQLRGGLKKKDSPIKVRHTIEILADRLNNQ